MMPAPPCGQSIALKEAFLLQTGTRASGEEASSEDDDLARALEGRRRSPKPRASGEEASSEDDDLARALEGRRRSPKPRASGEEASSEDDDLARALEGRRRPPKACRPPPLTQPGDGGAAEESDEEDGLLRALEARGPKDRASRPVRLFQPALCGSPAPLSHGSSCSTLLEAASPSRGAEAEALEQLFLQGRLEEARRGIRHAQIVRRQTLGEAHLATLECDRTYGRVLHEQRQLDEAEAVLRRALEACAAAVGRRHRQTLFMANDLAGLLQAKGELHEAAALFDERLRVTRELYAAEDVVTLGAVGNLADVLREMGQAEEAARVLADAPLVARRVLGEDNYDTLVLEAKAALISHARGTDSAESALRHVLGRMKATLGTAHFTYRKYHAALQAMASARRSAIIRREAPAALCCACTSASLALFVWLCASPWWSALCWVLAYACAAACVFAFAPISAESAKHA